MKKTDPKEIWDKVQDTKEWARPEIWDKLQDAKAWSHLSVSELYRLCIAEEIEAVHIVKPGKKKGVRLIKRQSLEAYIQSFMPGGSRYQKHQLEEAK